MENHHFFHGKIHYFDWVIFNSYFDITRGYLVFGRYQGIKNSDQAESDLAQDRGIKIAGIYGCE